MGNSTEVAQAASLCDFEVLPVGDCTRRGRRPAVLALLGIVLLLPALATASPVIPAFERFHADKATAEGGRLLMQELNCAACHEAPTALPRTAPNLAAVGDRLAITALQQFIAKPHAFKPGTLMPDLRVTDADAEAIAHYLASRRSGKSAESANAGDAAAGKKLYHEIGCVACHSSQDKPLAGSVPLELGRHYRNGALARFLLNPENVRPAGRMPDMKLTPVEAASLSAYLNPEPSAPAQPQAKLIASGKIAYTRYGCASCHEPPDKAKPVAIAKLDRGCLSAKPVGKAPNFMLTERQQSALRLALQEPAKQPTAAKVIVDHSMQALNCYACHARQGKGGVEEARRDYFHANDPDMHAVGDLGIYPPSLDVVGRKLTKEWLEKILVEEGGEVRPYLKTRMPRFQREVVASILDNLPVADKRDKPIPMDTSGLQRHHRGHYGRALLGTGKGGLACVTCHGLQGKRAIGSGVIDITKTVERLQPGYFKELLLNPASVQPGTIMPPLFNGRRNANQEIEQIWTYLKEAEQQKLPDGLLREDKYELFPAKEAKPIVFRTFIHGVGSHAIAVGYPEGVNAGFDAYASRWAILWRGRFLDAGTTWTDRFSAPDKPLGSDLKALPSKPAFTGDVSFRGFRLDADQRPVFLYAVDKWQMEDQLIPEGKNFKRRLTVTGPDGELNYRPLLGGEEKPLSVKNGKATIEEVVTW